MINAPRQFNLGQGNPGDAAAVWDPIHGLEPSLPLYVTAPGGPDCNGNGVPDDCELDCNGNGTPDECDITNGDSADCQPNAVPDECDIASGLSQDLDHDGTPDECQLQACCTPNPPTPDPPCSNPPYTVCCNMRPIDCLTIGCPTCAGPNPGEPMGPGSRCTVPDDGFFSPDSNPGDPDACWYAIVPNGSDEFVTPPDGAQFDFCETPIPADFFDPGSLPFDGLLFLGGALAPDTKVRRFGELAFPPRLPNTPPAVQVQIEELSLVGTQPIDIAYCDGHTELWDVSTCGLAGPQGFGTMAATRTHENGGTFDAQFPVQAYFIFVRQSDGVARTLDTFKEGQDPIRLRTHQPGAFTFVPNPFTVASVHPNLNLSPNFVPGLEEQPNAPNFDQCCKDVGHSADYWPGYQAGHLHITGLDCAECAKGACCDGGTCYVETLPDCLARTNNPDAYKGNGTNCDDADLDGIPDAFESNDCCQTAQLCATSTNPHSPDTDGDGCLDGGEVQANTDPCNPCDPIASCTTPSIDCNANGTHDDCEVSLGLAPDCNANGVPDDCDLAPGGPLTDGDGSGLADQCEFSLLITEIVAGPLPGGPRWAEITNCGPAQVDLGNFSVLVFENGMPGPAGTGSQPMSGLLHSGQSYVLAWERPADLIFEGVYGFPPDQFVSPPYIDGDDALGLFLGQATWQSDGALSGTLYDVYGVTYRDGTARRWDYSDGYASRDRAEIASAMFNSNGWYSSGAGALVSDPPGDPAPLQALTLPHAYECGLAFCDCNHNGMDDTIDLLFGASDDCNSTGVPDECELRFLDYDNDSDVDLLDYDSLAGCLAGPAVTPPSCTAACRGAFDTDDDGDVDLLDLAVFTNAFGSTQSLLRDSGTCNPPALCSADTDEEWCHYDVTSFRQATQAECALAFPGLQRPIRICVTECPVAGAEKCPPMLLKDTATGCLFSVARGAGCASCEADPAGGRWRLIGP